MEQSHEQYVTHRTGSSRAHSSIQDCDTETLKYNPAIEKACFPLGCQSVRVDVLVFNEQILPSTGFMSSLHQTHVNTELLFSRKRNQD